MTPELSIRAAYVQHRRVAMALAQAFVSGEQTLGACVTRGTRTLGGTSDWLQPLARHYINTFAGRVRPTYRDAEAIVRAELWAIISPELFAANELSVSERPKKLAENLERLQSQLTVTTWLTDDASMQPVSSAAEWNVPVIESTGALAEWLGISLDDLAWFDTPVGCNRSDTNSKSHHYHYRLTKKQSGGFRLIEAPQRRLKNIQRRILSEILERVPNYYAAAHGFVKGRSVKTFAAPHVDKAVVVRMDLRDFFPQIGRARVAAVFRTMGYPEPVAAALAALCTNVAPRSLFTAKGWTDAPAVRHLVTGTSEHCADAVRQSDTGNSERALAESRALYDARKLYVRAHLPQGAPTSPALANICGYRMDCRLTGLADWANATYTRYADDIAFSGGADFARHAERYSTEIAVIAASEGWSVQHRKTRIMRRGVRQHLAGIVLNRTLSVPRADYDALKAILTNCLRNGAESQNRAGIPNFRAHLAGRVSWIGSVHAGKGKRLRELLNRIAW